MFRILNASATETIELALPGHEFNVVALDGNPVPHPNKVKVLQLGSAERVDAIVEMKNPGVWILGTPMDEDRNRGMGIVVEYAGRKGKTAVASSRQIGLELPPVR
jgi:FtsP/CotA-like multicopper oxidase with cupredoxin domain